MPSLLSHIAPPCCSPACRLASPLASPLFLPDSTPPTSPHSLAQHRRLTPAPPPTARHRLRLSLSFPSASPPMLLRHPFPASTPTQCPSFRPSAASSRIRRLSPARRRGAGAAVAEAAAGDGAGDVQTFILTAGALAAAAVSLRLALKVPLSAHPLRAPTPPPLLSPLLVLWTPPPSNALPSSHLPLLPSAPPASSCISLTLNLRLLPALSHMFPSPFHLVTPVLCPSSVHVAGLAGGTACVFCEGGKMAGKDGRLMDCRVCKGAGEGAWGQVRAHGGR
ncbi:unnamed protein product [Closterium sp. Naga37s-1]|nr:unnamed protein product [Closterium sp. Naga37s-1]